MYLILWLLMKGTSLASPGVPRIVPGGHAVDPLAILEGHQPSVCGDIPGHPLKGIHLALGYY